MDECVDWLVWWMDGWGRISRIVGIEFNSQG